MKANIIKNQNINIEELFSEDKKFFTPDERKQIYDLIRRNQIGKYRKDVII